MNAAHAIGRLEEAGLTQQQAAGVVEVIQGKVVENIATRDYVGEQIALVRKELAEQIGAVRRELAEQIGSVRQELAEQIGAVRRELAQQIGETRTDLMHAINRLAFWMNGFLAALLVAVLGICGVLIGKL
jgi:small-conductance mechanosensitive channel